MIFGTSKAIVRSAAGRLAVIARSGRFGLAGAAVLAAAVAVIGAAWAYYYAGYAVLGPLEATVFFAAERALSGSAPAADVPFAGMPLLPYWVGLSNFPFGAELLPARLMNAGAALLGVAVLLEAWRRRGAPLSILLPGSFVVMASPWFWALVVSDAGVAAATLTLCAGAAALVCPRWRPWRSVAVGIACAMAAGVHAQAIPAAVLLVAGTVAKGKNPRARILAAAPAAVVFVLGVLGAFAFGFDEVLFFNWTLSTLSQDTSIFLVRAVELWRVCPAVILTALATLFALRRLAQGGARFELCMWALSTAAVVVPILPGSAHGYDGVFALPLMVFSTFAACARSFRAIPSEKRPVKTKAIAHVVWLLPAITLLYPLPQTVEDETMSEELIELAALVSEVAPDAEQLMSPVPSLATWLNLDVVSGTELGLLSMGGSAALAKSYGLMTYRKLARVTAAQKADVVILMTGARRWNFRLVLPTFEEAPSKTYREFRRALDRSYRTAGSTRSFEVLVLER